jgi:selT/selW/selH-like putative selenoprotein
VIEDTLSDDATIEPGSSGEFTVWSDGELVFSKADAGRFPEHDEILEKLR